MHRVRRLTTILAAGLLGSACRSGASSYTGDGGTLDAHATFLATCAKCHGERGHADTPTGQQVGARDLTRDEARRMSDAEIAHQIVAGKGRMPAFGSVFSEAEVKALVGEVRKLQR